MARFLMMPHAPGGTLAHLAACSAVAGALRERGHDAIFAYGGSRPELLDRAGFEWHPVVEAGGPMYWEWFETVEHLERMVSSQLELIARLQPAACVTSAGFAGIAAEVNGLPRLALMHTLAGTRFGRMAILPWMLRDAARHPTRLLGHLRARRRRPERDRARTIIAEVRRRRGLPPPVPPGAPITTGGVFAYTTTPFLDPARGLPAHYRYVGPLSYGGGRATAAEPPATEAPRIYVSQGSTGSAQLLRDTAAELSAERLGVVVSTGGLCEPRELRELGSEVVAESILDTRCELEAADAAVIAGGQMTAMEALRSGTPTVVVPHTNQQAVGALRAERLGTGIALWPRVRRGAIARATLRILRDQGYADRAGQLAAQLSAGWDGNARAAALAESLVSPQRPSESSSLSEA